MKPGINELLSKIMVKNHGYGQTFSRIILPPGGQGANICGSYRLILHILFYDFIIVVFFVQLLLKKKYITQIFVVEDEGYGQWNSLQLFPTVETGLKGS